MCVYNFFSHALWFSFGLLKGYILNVYFQRINHPNNIWIITQTYSIWIFLSFAVWLCSIGNTHKIRYVSASLDFSSSTLIVPLKGKLVLRGSFLPCSKHCPPASRASPTSRQEFSSSRVGLVSPSNAFSVQRLE